jgi:uncharacterized protein YqgC (DUF456 family)
MSAGSELLIAIIMAIGIIGTVIPLIPGLALVWFAGAIWAYFDGGDGTRMWLLALMTLFAVIGFTAQFLLPAAAVKSDSPPRNTLLVGGLFGLIGFFIYKVVLAHPGGGFTLPSVGLFLMPILQILSVIRIYKDESMVKAADRLR